MDSQQQPQPHSRRRHYPQAHFTPAQPAVAPSLDGYNAGAAPAAPGVAYGGMAPPMPPMPSTDGLANQMGGLSVTEGAAVPGNGAAIGYDAHGGYAGVGAGAGVTGSIGGPGYGVGGVPANPISYNSLYTEDLLKSLPPPVNDLDFPPPPLQVPADAMVTGSPYAEASPDYFRSTLNVIPRTGALLKKSKLPFALVVRPMTALKASDENIPVVNDACVARCRRCRTYIHPFVEFVNQGQRWKCNVCSLTNDVPSQFDWDALESKTKNRMDRNEINYGVVDFVAPKEYLVRPPQPPVYVFVLDVSVNAVSSGLVSTAARVIKDSLDKLPNADGRTRVAFLAVDGSLNYFQIPLPKADRVPGTEDPTEIEDENIAEEEPRMLVVSDLEKPFLPTPTGLLVNLSESRRHIDQLLDSLPQIFSGTVSSSNCLGSALQASLNMVANIGGKIICINASLPNAGIALLEQRENRSVFGTSKETPLFSPAQSFYKSFAVDCNKANVTVDMFLLGTQYQDVASLSSLPKYTGGNTFCYPGWSALRPVDVFKFSEELTRHLTKDFAMEAVLRIRASSGIHSTGYYGHFFTRSSDLMAFSTFNRDASYVVELAIDENINRPWVVIQSALLHTTCFGERRIRVMTLAIPTSSELSDVYASADQQAITAFYAHQAADKVIHAGIPEAHDMLLNRLLDIFKVFKNEILKAHAGSSGALGLCTNLRLLPLLVLALKKTIGLRRSPQIMSDIRMTSLNLLQTLPLNYLLKYLYPDFYALHELPDEAGQPDPETGAIVLPPRLNLSGASMMSHGLYLIDDGQVIFLWVAKDVVPQLLLDAFGVDTVDQLPQGKTELPVVDTDLNIRIRNLLEASRVHADSVYYPSLYVISEASEPTIRLWATSLLVEDRTDTEPTYHQFLNTIREKLSN